MQGFVFPAEASAPLDISARNAAVLLIRASLSAVAAEDSFIPFAPSAEAGPLFRKNVKDVEEALW